MKSIGDIVGDPGRGEIVQPRNEDEACRMAVFMDLLDQQAERGEGNPLINYVGSSITINVDIIRLMNAIKGALQ